VSLYFCLLVWNLMSYINPVLGSLRLYVIEMNSVIISTYRKRLFLRVMRFGFCSLLSHRFFHLILAK